MADTLRIVMAQLNLRVGDIPGNLERIVQSALSARDDLQAQAIVFPELALSGYPPEDLLLRSNMQSRVESALQSLCERCLTRSAILLKAISHASSSCTGCPWP